MSLDVHVSLSNHVNSHADEDSECRRALKERGYVDICDTIRIESARNMKALKALETNGDVSPEEPVSDVRNASSVEMYPVPCTLYPVPCTL